MNRLNFKMDDGVLQVTDMNPSVGGMTTRALTNPKVDDDLEAAEQAATGQLAMKKSPFYYIIPFVVLMIVIGYLQK